MKLRMLLHKCFYLVMVLLLCAGMCSHAQSGVGRYNVDSLLKRLSVNDEIRAILNNASHVYKAAGISRDHISLNAFKMACLEKSFFEKGLLPVVMPPDSVQAPYSKSNLITVVDFTRKGNRKRWITVDLDAKKILYNTLVSHGAASGKGKEALMTRLRWPAVKINGREQVPLFFGNDDSSGRSSLGLVLALKSDYPDNLCHLCREFATRPHKCIVLLAGLEAGINDHMLKREIVVHTTGSADLSDSLHAAMVAAVLPLNTGNAEGLRKDGCRCRQDTAAAFVSAYAASCGIADNKGYIGRSSGCLVLPENQHRPVIETIQGGSLLFVYSDRIAPGSTNYFATSPFIAFLLQYVATQ